VPALGEAPIEAITSAHVDAFRAQLVGEDRLAARTINKYLALIHGILKRAQRVYGLSANAAAGVERQPVRRSGDFDVLSAEEVEALIRAAGSSQDAALYATASYAGLRLGEPRALRWRDVDFGKRLIHVRRSYVARNEGAPKSGRVRSVPMVDQVARALDELSRREHFTERRGPRLLQRGRQSLRGLRPAAALLRCARPSRPQTVSLPRPSPPWPSRFSRSRTSRPIWGTRTSRRP
jgi:integrase